MRRIVTVFTLALLAAACTFSGCDDKTTDPSQATWHALANDPREVYRGGAMVWDGGDSIYALRGDPATRENDGRDEFSKDFWRYDITADEWVQLQPAPSDPYWSSSLAWDGDDFIYYLKGNGTDRFFRYSISGTYWEDRADTPETGVRHCGNSLVWPEQGDFLYAVRGDAWTDFWRYEMTLDTWIALANVPSGLDDGNSITWGGDDLIFATAADTTFWCYDISENEWAEKDMCPYKSEYGGWTCYDGFGTIYAVYGGGWDEMWAYDIEGDTWEWAADLPAPSEDGGAIVSDGVGVYMRPGEGSPEFWVFQ